MLPPCSSPRIWTTCPSSSGSVVTPLSAASRRRRGIGRQQERAAAVVEEPLGAAAALEQAERQAVGLEVVRLGVVHRHEQPGRRHGQPEAAECRRERRQPRHAPRQELATMHHVLRHRAAGLVEPPAGLRHQRALRIGEDQMLELRDRLGRAAAGPAALPRAPARPPARCRARLRSPPPGRGARRRPAFRWPRPGGRPAAALRRRPSPAADRIATRSRPATALAVSPRSSSSKAWPSAGSESASIGCSIASSAVRSVASPRSPAYGPAALKRSIAPATSPR